MATPQLVSTARGGIGVATLARGVLGDASLARGEIGVAALARGGRGFSSLARGGAGLSLLARSGAGLSLLSRGGAGLSPLTHGGAGLSPLARGGAGVTPLARGGTGVTPLARGGAGVTPLARGGTGIPSLAGGGPGVARGAARGFSSSTFKKKLEHWKDYEPSDRTVKVCSLLGGLTSVSGFVGYGYYWLSSQVENKVKVYVDSKLVDMKAFQNIATGTHHETVRKFNEAMHQMQRETSELRSKILQLEQKEFDQRKELQLAAELLRDHQTAAANAGAK